MTTKEILDRLRELGDEKVVARNRRHGAGNNQYGVKLGDIRKLGKKIGKDHHLALELWKTGNMEARLLSILIAEPARLSPSELDRMVKSLQVPQVADWFNAYILKDHPARESLREKWMDSSNVYAARSGWSLTANQVSKENELDFNRLLKRIETEMPVAPAEVQWTMNATLAQIGIHAQEHRDRALEIGERLGIYRDYPVSRGCTSPFAPIWIKEMVRRQKD